MTINDIIRNSENKWQYSYDNFKENLTEENRMRYEALKAKGFEVLLFTYSEWQILAWDSFKDNDDESSYSGEYEMTDKNNDFFNSAMEKLMDEFENYIGEDWAGTEEDIIERMAAKQVAEYRQSHKGWGEDEYGIDDAKWEIETALYCLGDGLSDGDTLWLGSFLSDETMKRYEEFKTFDAGDRIIEVRRCKYIPVDDFVEFRVEVEEVDEWNEIKQNVYLSMDTRANPKPNISVKIKDPKSIRSIYIAANQMVNDAMDLYDGMREMYRSYRAESLKK